ncbi:unnamed protein product, partial [Larinioides sclopetarius]
FLKFIAYNDLVVINVLTSEFEPLIQNDPYHMLACTRKSRSRSGRFEREDRGRGSREESFNYREGEASDSRQKPPLLQFTPFIVQLMDDEEDYGFFQQSRRKGAYF